MTLGLSRFPLEMSRRGFRAGTSGNPLGGQLYLKLNHRLLPAPISAIRERPIESLETVFLLFLTPMYWPKCNSHDFVSFARWERDFLLVFPFADATGCFIPLLCVVFVTIRMETSDDSKGRKGISFLSNRW